MDSPASITETSDNLRTGWYTNQPDLSPTNVQSASFGKLFAVRVNGQVYAQPLVSNGVLLIATENNNVYGFDHRTGVQHWVRHLGTPWDPTVPDVRCSDLVPSIGITGTPVIDTASNTAYMFTKTYDSDHSDAWFAHALDILTGDERQNFPVRIRGSAANDSSTTFDAKFAMQRPALLLMDGVIYAGFGGHCDKGNYRGWVVGVSTAGNITTLFSTAVGTTRGAGIWQSGGGLVSDGPGTIIFTTGNIINGGLGDLPIVGSHPPANLDEAVVRLSVEPNGSLRAVDFFATADTEQLDILDADLGSGSPVALPELYFGTPTVPRLLVQIGKQGRLMLLDRNNLGGYRTAAALGDNLLAEIYIAGGLWGRPSVWGGNGGYIYLVPNNGSLTAVKYAIDTAGNPSVAVVGTSTAVYGYTSGSPIVTSDAALPGTALVWVIGSNGADGSFAALRAYDAIPFNGIMDLRFEVAIGTATKFAVPGVDSGKVYVGTRDGMVYCYGSPTATPLNGQAVTFSYTVVSQSQVQQLTVTANQDLTITALSSTSNDFVVASPPPTLPRMLNKGQTLSLMVNFFPTRIGPTTAAITFTTSAGVASVTLSGQGIKNGPYIVPGTYAVSFTGTTVGTKRYNNVAFSNNGSQTLVINNVIPPVSPFLSKDLPAIGTTIAPGAVFIVELGFGPQQKGAFYGTLELYTNGGTSTVGITGTSAKPGKLSVSTMLIDFGTVTVGKTEVRSFSLTNVGEEDIVFSISKAPSMGQFVALTELDEGTILHPSNTLYERVAFTPTSSSPAKDYWKLNANDYGGARYIVFTGNN